MVKLGKQISIVALSIGLFSIAILSGFEALAAPTRAKAKAVARGNPAHTYLSTSVWRASECTKHENFQAFFFVNPAKVEVGSGTIGDGERLEILSAARNGNILEIRTRVCAPVGCNQTLEQYKIISQNQMQEWRFEGLLPNEAPNVVVLDGVASDGTAGRVFNRCGA
jgi:hypothetical protein